MTRDVLVTACGPMLWGSTYFFALCVLPQSVPFQNAALRILPIGLVILLFHPRSKSMPWTGRQVLLAFLFEDPLANSRDIGLGEFAGLVYLAVPGTLLAHTLWFRGVSRLDPRMTLALRLLSPVIAGNRRWQRGSRPADASASQRHFLQAMTHRSHHSNIDCRSRRIPIRCTQRTYGHVAPDFVPRHQTLSV